MITLNIDKFCRVILIAVLLLVMVACSDNSRINENETSDSRKVVDSKVKSLDTSEDEIIGQSSEGDSVRFENFEIYNSDSITYSELKNVSDDTFKKILEVLESINFSKSILKEDLYKSVSLRSRYLKVLKGEEKYNNCLEQKGYSDLIEYDPKNIEKYAYYYVDINGDEVPEVIVFGDMRYAHIFSYDVENDKVELRDIFKLGNGVFLGDNKFEEWHSGTGLTYEFYELSMNGERKSQVYFHSEGYYNDITQGNDEIHMVGFGEDSEELKEMEQVSTDQVEQIYRDNETYFLKISRNQYDQITSDFFASKKMSEEFLSDAVYTYDKLFGDLEQ